MTSIIDIGKNLKRQKQIKYANIFFLIILIAILLVSSILKVNLTNIYLIFVILSCYFFISISDILKPRIKVYDMVRYNLYYLNNSLSNRNLEKSIDYLNDLAYNIKKIITSMERVPFTDTAKETLANLNLYLKYEVYPCLSNQRYVKEDLIDELGQIEKAVELNDLGRLQNLIQNKTFDTLNASPLFTYEKDSIIKKHFIIIRNTVSKAFYENFVFRVTCIITILLIIGFVFSNITTISFDTTFISALIVLGSVIAQHVKSKE